MEPVSDNNLFKLFLSKISNNKNDLSKFSSNYCNDTLKELDSIAKNNNVEFANKEEILYNFSHKTVQEAKDTVEKIIKENNENTPKSNNNFRIFLPSGYQQTLSDIKSFITDLKNKMKADPTFKGTKSSSTTSQEEQINLIKSQNELLNNLSSNIQNLNYNLTKNNNYNNYSNLYSNNQIPYYNNFQNNIENEYNTSNENNQPSNVNNNNAANNSNSNGIMGIFQFMLTIMKTLMYKLNETQNRLAKLEQKMKHK